MSLRSVKANAFYLRALLGVVAFTTLVIIFFGRPQTGTTNFWEASSFNPNLRGHKALYVTLSELHWPVARWQESYRELSGTNQVLLMARNSLGRRYNLEPLEIDQLLNWVKAGNHLILFGDFADSKDARPLLKQLGFPDSPPLSAGDRIFEQGSQLLSSKRKEIHLSGLVTIPETDASKKPGGMVMEQCLPLPSNLPPAESSKGPFALHPLSILLGANDALTYGLRVFHGQGSVTFIASSSLIDNTFLPQAHNLPFVLSLLQPQSKLPEKIWFEEAHHGYRTTFALMDLFRHPGVKLALGQILIGVLVYLSAQLFRFGPIRPLHRETGRSTVEFVNSLANLYRRADIRKDIVEMLFRETHASILRKFNLPERTGHEVLAQRLQEAFPQLPKWKKLAQRFDSNDYVQGLPPTGWLKVSRELILIKNAMI